MVMICMKTECCVFLFLLLENFSMCIVVCPFLKQNNVYMNEILSLQPVLFNQLLY